MESLEDVDLVRALNFSTSLKYLRLVEEELAGVILAARERGGGGCRVLFPPLKPRYATLLQVTAARFGLTVATHGWGDERRISVTAGKDAALPCVQCEDFRPLGGGGALASRLADVAKPSEAVKKASEEAGATKAAEAASPPGAPTEQAEPQRMVESLRDDDRQPEARRKKPGGMRGWGDDDDGEASDDDWIAKRRRASEASGRVPRGRGFAADGGKAAAAAEDGAADGEEVVKLQLQKDYAKYAIDPDDTWRPHRKPYTELEGGWEFSGAWTFDPDDNERFEEGRPGGGGGSSGGGFRGVAAWRVEHAKGGDFTVAFADGSPADARSWLEQRGGRRGEEPFVLELRLDVPGCRWEYRFGRASKRQGWKALPWSNAHRTSFWAATLPGEDGKQHLAAGLDEFPERRFLFAKVRMRHRIFGFGPPLDSAGRGAQPFYVRDVVVFGRLSLLPPPFASRDHFVELPGRGREDTMAALQQASHDGKVAAVLELPKGAASLLVCRSAEDAREIASSLGGAIGIRSSEWSWPPCAEGGGVAAAQAHKAATQECWAKLQLETTRELAIFEENLQRRTKHLEGLRIARASATRMILGNLRGDAPLPNPPQAGV